MDVPRGAHASSSGYRRGAYRPGSGFRGENEDAASPEVCRGCQVLALWVGGIELGDELGLEGRAPLGEARLREMIDERAHIIRGQVSLERRCLDEFDDFVPIGQGAYTGKQALLTV